MIIYHLMRADFLDRTRRYSFLVMLGAAIYLGFLVNNGTVGVVLGKYRGEYNSAWVGAMMSLVATFFLSWFGFYLVKNTIQRDERTGVGQIIATTPLSKLRYVAGKALSNFAVLAIMVVILILAAIVLQLLSRETSAFSIRDLVSPFLLVTLPALAVVASLAVLFESIPLLSGGFGNVVFFFGWVLLMMQGIENQNDLLDISALHTISESMKEAVKQAHSDYIGGFVLGSSGDRIVGTFHWGGIPWTRDLLLIRLGWICFAPIIVLCASLLFNRFDGSREQTFAWRRKTKRVTVEEDQAISSTSSAFAPRHLTLTSLPNRFRLGQLVAAELRLLLKGKHWWWYAVGLGLIIASIAAPIQEARQIVFPIAWIWPLLVWSSMGNREDRFRTHEIVFSTPRALSRQLPATLLAGVILAMIAGSGILFRLLFTADWTGIAMWIAGASFIPAFALASGVWSGSGKLFEVGYLCLWYVGPMSKTAELDFIGAAGVTAIPYLPLVYLALSAVLYLMAFMGRKKKLSG